MREYKLVVLGAGGVGKSCLTVQFVQDVFVNAYDPTIEDSYRKQIEVDGRLCDLEILDTAGVAQFTAMRELYIKSGKGFLLVYSVTDPASLQELLSLREKIIQIKNSLNIPMVLIGNKCDLTKERLIKPENGIQLSQEWGKIPFYETSAMNKINVDEAFIDVVRQIMRRDSEIAISMNSPISSDFNNSNNGSINNTIPNNVSNASQQLQQQQQQQQISSQQLHQLNEEDEEDIQQQEKPQRKDTENSIIKTVNEQKTLNPSNKNTTDKNSQQQQSEPISNSNKANTGTSSTKATPINPKTEAKKAKKSKKKGKKHRHHCIIV